MEIIFGLVFLFFGLATLILPWRNRSHLKRLQIQVDAIQAQLGGETLKRATEQVTAPPRPAEVEAEVGLEKPAPIQPQPEVQPAPEKKRLSFEQQFGARLPVWIGGIALAFAGFYMVKYSIESGLLSPTVRVALGLLFGVGLLYAAAKLRAEEAVANGTRIAQALSGAGIAVLYVCVFAATSLYNLIPSLLGFLGMAVVTATAVTLSLRHGMPIALLGLVGGFLTPAMVGSNDPSTPVLFIYLYFVVAGLLVVIRKQRWWGMAIFASLGALLWVLLWVLSGNFSPFDSLYLGVFLMAVSATVVATSREYYKEQAEKGLHLKDAKSAAVLNYITLAGSMALMASITVQAEFGVMQWGLFGLLALGGVGLAYFNQRLYGLVPWISMGLTALMLLVWNAADSNAYALVLVSFAVLYIASGYVLQGRSERPLLWSGLVAATSIGYYLLAYFRLHDVLAISFVPLLWGAIAVEFAGLGSLALKTLYHDIPTDHPQKQHVLAVYAATVTAFISIGLTIELPREFLSVAIAVQLVAVGWISTKLGVEALRKIVGVLACVFGALLIPQIILLMQLTAYSLVEAKLTLQSSVPIVNWPLFQLGVPALCFAGASLLLRKKGDGKLIAVLEVATIALLGVMGYYLARHAFHPDENVLFVKAGFFERGVITNCILLYGLGCLWLGRNYARRAISACGCVLCGVAIFRTLYFDMLAYNPLWSWQPVGAWPLINGLLINYALPAALAFKVAQELILAEKPQWSKYVYGFVLIVAFAFVTLSVRQLFHGTLLNQSGATNAETYTYSLAWLLFGLVLLFMGTLKKDKMIRVASLVIMIFTVGKVFLYDASELEGLFRVFSFLGLGISLLGLSWFYTRFVFGKHV